jgi:hypothetical protein
MEISFNLNPLFPEDSLKINGKILKENKSFSLFLKIFDPKEIIKFSNKKISKPSTGLWERTCFEVFLKDPSSSEYLEFNFSADNEWNCYHFENQRTGMKEFQKVKITHQSFKNSCFEVSWIFDTLEGPFYCGITSVIQKKNLQKSYWALVHPNRIADFHDPKSFLIQLP